MLACIGMEYISKRFFILELVTSIGLLAIFNSSKFILIRKDVLTIIGFSILMLGVVVSRIFFTTHLSMFLNVSFVTKLFLFFLFLYFFITRYGLPYKSLMVIACFSLPHFIGYVLGTGTYVNGQYGGFQGDPNYLGPDLLAAFGASFVLVNNKKIGKLRIIFTGLFTISFLLILLSVSRTATMSAMLILLFYFFKKAMSGRNSFWLKVIASGLILGLLFLIFAPDLSEIEYVQRLYDRFFNSAKGGDLMENERYFVWGISFNLIQESGLFIGYGIEEFLAKQYHFLSHNSWLDIGIKMGSYTFWTHALLSLVGLVIWGFKYLKRITKIPTWGMETFMFIFSLSISIMMFSISVSHMYYYWFIISLIYILGILPRGNKIRSRPID
ncbi:hypothetical protein LCGC14_0119110 [marine sediment metagenome]|uniref:O-antigen ligase-related domain-containing protein n=2 Tax=root TaxID=1 RepID=A0A0F9VN70_9ZZZZ|nr:hypothetical protein [Maribacter sp.]